ncbi:MAG: hypothetical protein DRH07_06420 [Deltaproteobacteria bacterium]|nr:MAG: hypothetical protein DRH07_06420 [Deltaproteobacteria bacterium]
MEQKEFQKLLLETVICSIACDGDIDDREIAELHKMINHAQYFKGLEIDDFLDEMIQAVKSDGRTFLGDYFKQLKEIELSPMQELLVLEVVLRIIQADERIDDNETAFLKLVRSNFNVHDEIIQQRFGTVPYLTGSSKEQYLSSVYRQEDVNVLAGKIERVAEHEKSFDGLFDKFMDKTVELDIE